jgi:uncharacterized protein (TIGR02118 family)
MAKPMLKFLVVLYKLPALSDEQFCRYLLEVHGPLAEKLPGLEKYVQNFVARDPTRKHPGWNAIVELYFDTWESMEAAWKSEEGVRATADLPAFADLTRTTWSVVEERQVRR